jgi:hypothetical protein
MREALEALVNEVVDDLLEGCRLDEEVVLETARSRLLEGIRSASDELPVEVLEGVRGNLLRGLEREPVPVSTVLPPPPSRARRLPREGVRMICLEDDEEGRVCYLDLGHGGAHGFEVKLAEGGPVRPGGRVLEVDPCPGWTDEELERFARAFGGRVTRVVVDCRVPPGRPVLIPSVEERANEARREAGHAG